MSYVNWDYEHSSPIAPKGIMFEVGLPLPKRTLLKAVNASDPMGVNTPKKKKRLTSQ